MILTTDEIKRKRARRFYLFARQAEEFHDYASDLLNRIRKRHQPETEPSQARNKLGEKIEEIRSKIEQAQTLHDFMMIDKDWAQTMLELIDFIERYAEAGEHDLTAD